MREIVSIRTKQNLGSALQNASFPGLGYRKNSFSSTNLTTDVWNNYCSMLVVCFRDRRG